MIPKRPSPGAGAKAAHILVVDDDRRVRELLEIALTTHGFVVLTAADGDEGIKQALAHRPDLVVLDVRLPKRSGLEVCEALRGDAEDPSVPIVLVSAASETEARLQAFARGADDYLAKPFSPKELVARIKRLLSRRAESRAAVQRARELERELVRAREEERRVRLESARERRLRELATELGRELLRVPDCDAIAQGVLQAVQGRLGIGVVALLTPASGIELEAVAVRGDAFERVAGLELRPDGELALLLAGLGRPVFRAELERIAELRPELAPFCAARFPLLAPLLGPGGLEGLLVMEERSDGTDLTGADLEILAGICALAVAAMQIGRRFREQTDRLIESVAQRTPEGGVAEAARAEAAMIVERAARATSMPPRQRHLVRHGVTLSGPRGLTAAARTALAGIRALDPTGRILELQELLEVSPDAMAIGEDLDPDRRRAALLVRAGVGYAESRARGAGIEQAMDHAVDQCGPGLDSITLRALRDAAREALGLQGDAA